MLRLLVRLGLLCSAVCILPVGLAAEEGDATKVVSRWQAAVLDTMRNASSLTHEARVQKLAPVLDETHDLAYMAQDRVGKSWDGLTEGQRTRYASLYRNARLAALSGRLYRFREETFKPVEEKADGDVVLVKTLEVRGKTETPYDYRLLRRDGRWRIVDVITKGISDQKRKGKEYQQLVEAQGFEALVAHLQKEIQQADESPRQVVTRLQDGVLAVMRQGAALGYSGRFEKLAPLIESTHDLMGMAQLAVGRAWKGWSKEQKRQYLKLFRQVSIARFASEFKTFAGESFAFRDVQPAKSSVVVRTTLTKSGGDKSQLDYFLRRVKGQPRVVNIRADGISELSSKKSAYRKALSGQGFPGLLDVIRAKIRRLESQ